MTPLRCPHCNVGLKVDEGKLPPRITFFKCPRCKESIPVSILSQQQEQPEGDTALIRPVPTVAGRLTVLADAETDTEEQIFPLSEGVFTVGRMSASSKATIAIRTGDRSMSREHIKIEVKKEKKGYRHSLWDNNSKNHTLYNSNCLNSGEVIVLNNNDRIVIGHTELRFNE